MPFGEYQTTNTASTHDWLRVTKDMTISAYDPTGLKAILSPSGPASKGDHTAAEPIFGTHLRETVATVKEWFDRK